MSDSGLIVPARPARQLFSRNAPGDRAENLAILEDLIRDLEAISRPTVRNLNDLDGARRILTGTR